jgi:hypothetical protein
MTPEMKRSSFPYYHDYALGAPSAQGLPAGGVCRGGGVWFVVVGNAGDAVGSQQPGLMWQMVQTWINGGELTRAPTKAPTSSSFPTPYPTASPVPITRLMCPKGKHFTMEDNKRTTASCHPCDKGRFGILPSLTTLTATSLTQYSQGVVSAVSTTLDTKKSSVSTAAGRAALKFGSTGSTNWGQHNAKLGRSLKTFCLPCPPGKYQYDNGQELCSSCPAGKMAPHAASTVCSTCQPGEVAAKENSVQCVPCAVGRSMGLEKVAMGASACAECANGLYQSSTGSTSCLLCPNGQIGADSRFGTPFGTVALPALWRRSVADACAMCASGRLYHTSDKPASPGTNNAGCTSCPPGRSNKKGDTACKDCVAGRFSARGKACSFCDSGSYQLRIGQASW